MFSLRFWNYATLQVRFYSKNEVADPLVRRHEAKSPFEYQEVLMCREIESVSYVVRGKVAFLYYGNLFPEGVSHNRRFLHVRPLSSLAGDAPAVLHFWFG